jgi:outer membrane protein OmpA-like peptidoglycan-associated protein
MGDASYDWKWNYIAPNVDLTFNLSNLFCGYNPNRIFNFSAFAGVGLNVAWGNDDAEAAKVAIDNYYNVGGANQNLAYLWDGTKVRVQGQIGVMADFRVTEKISLGLELSANTLGDRYNSKRAGNNDWYFNALAGVKIALGKTHTTREVKPCCPEPRVVEKIIERVVEKPVPVAPAVQEVAKVEPLRRDIFFTISSTKIVNEEMSKVAEIAEYLTKYPAAKVVITGYADRPTGNTNYNMEISQKRAQAVADAIISTGISSDRVTVEARGDLEQPFAEQELNRVAICIAEK